MQNTGPGIACSCRQGPGSTFDAVQWRRICATASSKERPEGLSSNLESAVSASLGASLVATSQRTSSADTSEPEVLCSRRSFSSSARLRAPFFSGEDSSETPSLCFTNARLFLLGPLSFSSTVSPSSPSFSQARAPHLPIDFCSAHPQLSHTRKGSPQVSSGSIARRAPRALRVH